MIGYLSMFHLQNHSLISRFVSPVFFLGMLFLNQLIKWKPIHIFSPRQMINIFYASMNFFCRTVKEERQKFKQHYSGDGLIFAELILSIFLLISTFIGIYLRDFILFVVSFGFCMFFIGSLTTLKGIKETKKGEDMKWKTIFFPLILIQLQLWWLIR